MTLRQFSGEMPTVPTATAWLVGDLGAALGKQELFTHQSAQRLKVLREHALIESAVSSNRIEGVEVEKSRITTLVFGTPALRDRGWHEGNHNPWPFINYVLWILKEAYKEFEQRVGRTAEPIGAKSELVRQAIFRQQGSFTVGALERACPGVGRDWIRSILRKMKAAGELRSFGHGAGARWERV